MIINYDELIKTKSITSYVEKYGLINVLYSAIAYAPDLYILNGLVLWPAILIYLSKAIGGPTGGNVSGSTSSGQRVTIYGVGGGYIHPDSVEAKKRFLNFSIIAYPTYFYFTKLSTYILSITKYTNLNWVIFFVGAIMLGGFLHLLFRNISKSKNKFWFYHKFNVIY